MADPMDALDEGEELASLLTVRYLQALAIAYGDAGEELEILLAFDVDNPRVQEILDELAHKVRRVAETTRDEIRALVGRQAAEGWSIDRLAEEIEGLAEIHAPRRARTIARTETASAYSRGSLAAYEESGVVTGVQWLTYDPCPICAPLDRQVAPLGEPFPGGIGFPPAHPSCRCAIAPVVIGDER